MLLKHGAIEAARSGERHLQHRVGHAVVGRPVRRRLAIEDALGSMAGGGGAGAHYGVGGQVLSECCPQHLAQLTQPSDVSLVDEAARIRGQVQEELGIAAH